MADPKIVRVVVGDDDAQIDLREEKDFAVLVGLRRLAYTGEQGISYAGAQGEAVSQVYGIAIAGPGGSARGGAGCVACAYDGGSAFGGDGSVAWARRNGPATVDGYGLASVVDSTAIGGMGSVAVALRQNSTTASAQAGPFGVAVVHNHPDLNANSRPALAKAASSSVAIAFDGNWVRGAMGALLVASYVKDGESKFAVGVVDGKSLLADKSYVANEDGDFVAV